ncbi:MAG: hypothetical protein LBJ23_04940 [Tannerella sp.]|jgi:hypothetical protein|nr:hypothetical protein [Tannerella sp.]
MKRYSILYIFLSVFAVAHSQQPAGREDARTYGQKQKEAIAQYRQARQRELAHYRDSINAEYARYLAETWKSFDMLRQERSFRPMPKQPVYQPDTPQPEPERLPVSGERELPAPIPAEDVPSVPPSLPDVPEPALKTVFLGTQITLNRVLPSVKLPSGLSEKSVAACWLALSKADHKAWTGEILRIKAELKLNDWGMYLLINKLFEVCFPESYRNGQVIFSVFMLNQMGYRAKIGKSENELIPLVAFRQEVVNCSYLAYGGDTSVKYSALHPQRKALSSVRICPVEYVGATNSLNLEVAASPRLVMDAKTRTLTAGDKSFVLKYNRNIVDFYADYPCVNFTVHATAAPDEALLESIEAQIAPHIAGESQEEAVNRLLHLVQDAFDYMTDNEQFGYEKWFFAEETVALPYSDCEDRAILFAQLVRRLLNMPVVLVHYPGQHLATAVKFDNPHTVGDYVSVDGAKYLICDPTCGNANLGMSMPSMRNVAVEVFKLK